MSQALKNCWIAKLYKLFQHWYSFSVIAAICSFFKKQYSLSVTKRVWDRLMLGPAKITDGSRLYKKLSRWDIKLHGRREQLKPILDGSVPGRIYYAVTDSRIAKSSVLCNAIFHPGMKRVLLVAFALFLPIDWALRDVSRISFLASIWDEVFLLGSIAYLILDVIFSQTQRKSRLSPLDMPIMLFLGAGLFLMFVNSPYFRIAIDGYRATVQYILWFFVVIRLIQDDQDIRIVCLIFTAMTTAIALHGIYQYIVAVPIPSSWTTATETGVRTRVFSIFGSPNIMGDFLALMAPITASLAYYYKDIRARVVLWGCVFLMCFACLFTFSRGAWVALAVAVFVFALYNDKRLIALMVLAGMVAINIPSVWNRISFLFTDEFVSASNSGGRAGRKALALLYLYNFSNPIFGFGLGMFGGAVAMQNQVYHWVSYCYVDNYYLKIFTEMGYIGIVAFAVMLLGLIVNCMRSVSRSRKKDDMGYIAGGMFAGLCGVLVHCCVENIFEEPYMMTYFWGIAAIVIYIGFIRNKENKG